MDEYQSIISLLALGMGTAWASGINLYATLLVLGLMGATGQMTLPPDLEVLTSPIVIGAAGLMYMVEFTVDKIPGVDNGWDAIHTVIRIPAGAVLAAATMGEVGSAATVAAAIVGGGLAMGTHATKAGSRVMVNTSPEPFSNFFVSVGEDIAVLLGLWTALNHPLLFIILLVLFVILLIWLLPKMWSAIKKVFSFISNLFSSKSSTSDYAQSSKDFKTKLQLNLDKNKKS
ncbi:MAG: DUF4126 domain-containing protein [Gammaproteobacteria bacterium]|nr:DUF4126 domain-containing protein [Gammaproteobacteria bacterium]